MLSLCLPALPRPALPPRHDACAAPLYWLYCSGLQQQYVLYSQPSLGAEARVVLDPNSLSTDGTVSHVLPVFHGGTCVCVSCHDGRHECAGKGPL